MAGAARVVSLHGREAEVRALGGALDLLASGRQAITFIEGEAGIGKTRLLTEALDQARSRGFEVALGRGEELEATRPFGVVAQALGCVRSSSDPRRTGIAALLATHGGADQSPITVSSDPGLQFRAVDAFVDLVEELALAGPLMIGLDDLQWADTSSLLTISALGRRLAGLPVGLIGCYRPIPHGPQLHQVVDGLQAAGARTLTLRLLTERAVAELVAEAVAAEPGPGLLREMAGAGGNALFVTELLAAIRREGILQITDGHAEVAQLRLPPTLRLTILRRLSFLPEETVQALRSASILGSSFTLTELSVSTARPALGLSMLLDEALAAGVLADDGIRLRFRHDLIRDAIYGDLPGSVRLALHREAGQRLAAAGAPTAQVAEQLARGATPGDTAAIDWLTRAAQEAAAQSPDVVADLLGRAIGLMPPAHPDRDQLLAEQTRSLVRAGRIADAEKACHALLDRAHDPAADVRARISLGLALVTSGHPVDGLQELERAADSAPLTDPDRATALGWASVTRTWLGDLDGAAMLAEQARAAAVSDGNHLATTVAMATLAVVDEHRGLLSDALDIADAAARLADQSPDRQGHRYPILANRVFILAGLDRFEEARSALNAGIRVCEELGSPWHLPGYQMAGAFERFVVGQWDDAIAEVESSLELADESGESFSLILGRSVLSLIFLHRNDLGRAAEAAAVAVGQLAETGARYRGQWAPWAQALVLEAQDKRAEAFVTLAEAWDLCTQLGFTLEYRALGPDLVRLALAVGDTARARDVSARVTELAARNEVPSLTGAALLCHGLAEDDPETLQAAVDAYAGSPRPLELALAAEDAGTAFARQGTVERARPLLERAVEIYERLDAARDVGRIEAVLREAGIRRGRRGPGSRPQHGWPSLTTTEQTVARLVAEGLSNPQIGDRLYISRRTVQTHLGHVFAKLDLTSRAQLAAAVTRHRDAAPASR
jgi:DNA-binding CsgD family transcriptional regulator/tetratricopeptide (TPR) repeat protein